jgi:hypothetical protein
MPCNGVRCNGIRGFIELHENSDDIERISEMRSKVVLQKKQVLQKNSLTPPYTHAEVPVLVEQSASPYSKIMSCVYESEKREDQENALLTDCSYRGFALA